MTWFGRKAEMRSFAEDTAGLPALGTSYRGIHAVPVDRIVGSLGRAHELRSDFMPIRRPHRDDRLRAVRARMERNEPLPLIEVLKLHDRYYVVDGHHRVASARKIGQLALDAMVTEYRPAFGASAA